MAVELRSVGVSPGANSTSCVIVKPAGLSVGDLMIAHTQWTDDDPVTPPEDWTSIRDDDSPYGDAAGWLFWKIADQDDVDATNFTFTGSSGAGTSNIGAITAWTGHNPSAPINANNGQGNNDSTTITSPEITPSVANCMILLFCAIEDDNTVSGYAIATDNPASWTEAYDIKTTAGGDCAAAMGYAIRPETSATGDGTADNSANDANVGQLVAIAPVGITETPQAVGGGSLATAGVLVRKTSASFGLGSIAIAGSLIKKTSIDVGFNAVGIAGALIKKTLTGVGSGAVATAGALSTIWTKVIGVGSGTVSSAGILVRKTSTSVGNGAIAITGTIVKKTSASFGQGSVALAGALIAARYHLKAVGSGVVSSAGTVVKAVVSQAQAVGDGAIAIAGSLTTVATHFKAVGDGAVAMSGNAAKKMYQTCGGALLDIRGYITERKVYKAVGSGAIALAGSLDTVKMKLQAVGGGAISLAGDLTKLPKKVVGGGTITIVGAVSKFPKKLVGYGTVSITGSIVKTISKSVGNAAVSIWGRANAFVAGVPYTLDLSFDTGMDFELTFDTGDTRSGYEPWELDLDFIGGGES